ncbi:MAG: tetratricopeptide repeat protein [Bacteroidaceae bacterium]|nr:tetratricopeptide repeat protein [Bacteroidaceae bacterium]
MDNLSTYISHPEKLNRETLYELRMTVGRHPYFDAARLLMLKNLYILHDEDFGKELRKAALHLKNRRVLFELMENYGANIPEGITAEEPSIDRTMSLIDAFLDTLPPGNNVSFAAEGAASIDYASTYLKTPTTNEVPKLRGQELIDEFLNGNNERITLQLNPENDTTEQTHQQPYDPPPPEASFFTETLANIYIKQGKYDKALEIIKRLCLEYPNKNRYFADQIRFLEKLVKYSKNK